MLFTKQIKSFFVACRRNFEYGQEGLLRNVHLDDALQFKSSVNLTAVANLRDSDGLAGAINASEYAGIAQAQPPGLAVPPRPPAFMPGTLPHGLHSSPR